MRWFRRPAPPPLRHAWIVRLDDDGGTSTQVMLEDQVLYDFLLAHVYGADAKYPAPAMLFAVDRTGDTVTTREFRLPLRELLQAARRLAGDQHLVLGDPAGLDPEYVRVELRRGTVRAA